MNEQKNKKYNLFMLDKRYREETISSFYFVPTLKSEKSCQPIDIDGERKKLNLSTGEIIDYKKSDIIKSINASIRRTKMLLDMLLKMNDFDWFCTLTFDKEKIDRTNDEQVCECYQKYINTLKHRFPTLRYVSVLDRHKDFCAHFHILLGGVPSHALGLVNSGKVCCHWATRSNGITSKEYYERTKSEHELRDTDGLTIYNITNFAYGLTTASRIVSRERCNTYVKKYINKAIGSTDIFKKRFYYSSNLNVPGVVKRMIGADFEVPKTLTLLNKIRNNPVVKYSNEVYYNPVYNVLQCRVKNDLREYLDKGLEPVVNNFELEEIDNIFKNENKQHSMFDIKE